ncbi:hypothetical protein ACHWQZ_G003248 [Mnemiopsis leidyi]
MKFLVALTIVLLVSTALGNIKKDTLKAHKKYRKLHGVKKLKWDNNVAEFAEKHCKYLADNDKFEHSKNSGYGENLYKAGGSGSADKAGQKATKMWYDEIKLYNYNNPGFSMQTGHFTQVVWKSSTKLGCAMATKGSSTWVCCNYSPPGNYQGQFPQNVLKLKN